VEGALEHLERAKLFYNEGLSSHDRLDAFRRFVASVYFARGAVEIMLVAARDGIVKVPEGDIRAAFMGILPHYELIGRLRVHDFHRYGLRPHPGVVMQGPISVRGGPGGATIAIGPSGEVIKETSGGMSISENRPVTIMGEKVLVEATGQYLMLPQILRPYLEALPEAIMRFRELG